MKRLISTAILIGLAGVGVLLIVALNGANGGEVLAGQPVPGASSDAAEGGIGDILASSSVETLDWVPVFVNASEAGSSTLIALERDTANVAGTGVVVDGPVVTIVSAGMYTFQGELADGRIVIDAGEDDDVTLVLDNVEIRCSTFSPIHVVNAGQVVIRLKDGTDNYVEDGDVYTLDAGAGEPNAAIFSHDDLTVSGGGALTVVGNYSNGIQSKDALVVEGGDIHVIAANDGLKGRDSVTVRYATLSIDSGGDGLQASNDEDPDSGNILIESGMITIHADADGIQAETTLVVEDGELHLVTGGGSANVSTQSGWGFWGSQLPSTVSGVATSAKGLKAGAALTISGGTIEIDSADDSIHSNGTLRIDDGVIDISSGDDGIHADTSIEINGGEIAIARSYEGIESMGISLNGGTIHLAASDDGINAAGGNDGSALGDRPGQNVFSESMNCTLSVQGGYIYVDAGGDGLDINGPITMTGGIVIVNGPTESMNGALDYSGSFRISGGLLIAAGSIGMAQAPSNSSSQNSVMINSESAVAAGTLAHIEDAQGNSIVTFEPTKTWQSLVLSSVQLEMGETYGVYIGGRSTGDSRDGLYATGSYTPGTELEPFTILSATTVVGPNSGQFGQPGRRRP